MDRLWTPVTSEGSPQPTRSASPNLDRCLQHLVEDAVLVEEEEIAASMRLLLSEHHQLVEGAAGAAVAAFLRDRENQKGRDVAIVLCGANVGLETLRSIL